MHYFAYGSNMNWPQMRERCPSTRFVGTALLPNYRMAFTRNWIKSETAALADALPAHGQKMWGVVYELSERDIGELSTH